MRSIVVGAGAIGGVVGGRLAQYGHDVVLIARGDHGQSIRADGLHVHDPSQTVVVRPRVCENISEASVGTGDVVLLAVKSQDTVRALDELSACAESDVPVVCLQNGMNNEREALRRFPNVYGAVVMCPTLYLQPGHVRAHSGPTTGIIDVGRFPHGIDSVVETVVAGLASSTFSSTAQLDIARWKWAKLAMNLGNAIEAACGPSARRGAFSDVVLAEGYAVFEAAGIDYASTEEEAARRSHHLDVQPVEGEPRPGGSSWQSLARGSSSIETDYLNGEVVMLGRLHGVETPANELLQRLAQNLAKAGKGPGRFDDGDLLALL